MKKRMLAVLCCIFFVFSMISPAFATSRVTFTNKPIEEPDLYITKVVESASPEFEAPADDDFTFTINVNGEAYKEEYFEVSTNNGAYEEYDAAGMPYQTDRYGRFTLKANQTAKFPYIGNYASYTVTEEPMEGYMQDPSTGIIEGYTKENAESITFTNIYVPKENSSQKTELQVYKHLQFPSGYQIPESPDFEFMIVVDGNAFNRETYEVFDMNTNQSQGTQETDRHGHFKLKGNQYAVFSDIPVDVDYEIQEIVSDAEGFRAVGETVLSGPTTYPLVRADFTNTEVSFGVNKTMVDGSTPDQDFTFVLSGEGGSVLSGVKYYLYNINGYLENDRKLSTNANGEFTLKAGQTAIFVGLDAGSIYSVKENIMDGYILQTPSYEGYVNKTVTDTCVVHPFVNKPADLTSSLAVTKTVQYPSGEMPDVKPDFTFILEKSNGSAYVPVQNAVYTIEEGTSTYSYKTDADGKFKLKDSQRALFSALALNTTYRVTEVDLPAWYTAASTEIEGLLTEEGLSMKFINNYEPDLKIQIHKVDANDSSVTLEGAAFKLYAEDKKTVKREGVTDAYGNIIFSNLEDGTYYLAETDAPAGYRKILGKKEIVLTLSDGVLGATSSYFDNVSVSERVVTIQIGNHTFSLMPDTGSIGTIVLFAAGVCLLGAGLFLITKKGKKKQEEPQAEHADSSETEKQ